MTLLESAAAGILPDEYAALITGPVTAEALAFQPTLATVVNTSAATLNVPVVKSDAGAAWVAEGAEIAPDDPVLDELTITPRKVAGLTIISRELATDSSPDAQQIVGDGLARSITQQINAAFVGNLAGPAPKGLASLTGITTVTGPLANLDPFTEAIAAAETAGATVTGFVCHPTDALTLAQLKDQTASNRPLLEDPRTIQGRPVSVSAKATPGTIWAVDASRVITAMREDVTLAVSDGPFFTSDRIALRATLRVAFGFPQPETVVKISIPAK